MLIYPDSLTDFESVRYEDWIHYFPSPTKTKWNDRERRAVSTLVDPTNHQVLDMGLPYGYKLDSAYIGKPIIHRSVIGGSVHWRVQQRHDLALGKATSTQTWETIRNELPTLEDPNFFYNHTLVFILVDEKLHLTALVHLSNGQLEDADEVMAVAEYFGLNYDP